MLEVTATAGTMVRTTGIMADMGIVAKPAGTAPEPAGTRQKETTALQTKSDQTIPLPLQGERDSFFEIPYFNY
jgi:hypothetical protein